MTWLKLITHQWTLWLIALGFFTRIPVKDIPDFQSQWLSQASRYYGLVGLFIGAMGALAWQLSDAIWPPAIAVILSMITTVLLTGGFHEDGLGDTWDGLGGGWTLEQKLTIMKDSRLGTYGALALILALLLKFQLLVSLAQLNITPMASLNLVVIALLCGHCLSRVLAVSIIYNHNYVRDIDSSKVKPMTEQQSATDIIVLLLTGLIPLTLLPTMLVLIVIATLIITRKLLVIWYNKQLGGYTGDLLGQAQQLSELMIYLTLLTYFTH
jgi:adenosylcobinamide-GDP ribazoletransferase